MENRNPNFSTWEAQNAWESYINNKLNNKPIIKERKWNFIQSSEFDNRYRHTDSFLYYDKNAFRVDYKAVTWNSKNDKGKDSNFVVNVTCFEINGDYNPVYYFIFIGKDAEYAYFVQKDKIITDEIKSVILSGTYGDYGHFSFRESKYDNSPDYILFKNEYIKNNADLTI